MPSSAINHARRVNRMNRSVLAFMSVAIADLQRGGFRLSMLSYVLTYKYDNAWKPEHVSEFMELMCGRLRRQGIPYAAAWALEVKDGSPHYHVVILVPYRTQLPYPNRKPKRGKVPWTHGWAGQERARSIPKTIFYITKRATKVYLPRGSRIFGTSGSNLRWKTVAAWAALAPWLRNQGVEVGEKLVKLPGIEGFVSMRTGRVHRCPVRCELRRDDQGRALKVFVERERQPDRYLSAKEIEILLALKAQMKRARRHSTTPAIARPKSSSGVLCGHYVDLRYLTAMARCANPKIVLQRDPV